MRPVATMTVATYYIYYGSNIVSVVRPLISIVSRTGTAVGYVGPRAGLRVTKLGLILQ